MFWWLRFQLRDDEHIARIMMAAFVFIKHKSAFSRRIAPEACKGPSTRQGVGNAGCPMHPQPRVRLVVKVCTRVFTAVAPEITRHPRTQWF
jgi:hypothetical protein